jgi:hypothetical protein
MDTDKISDKKSKLTPVDHENSSVRIALAQIAVKSVYKIMFRVNVFAVSRWLGAKMGHLSLLGKTGAIIL